MWHSKNAHGIHSPFLFDFYNIALKGKLSASDLADYNQIVKKLKHDNSILHHDDYGAGSRVHRSSTLCVSDLAKTSLKSKSRAAMLSRIVDFMEAKSLIELGTSFGTTTYLIAQQNPDCKITSIEGSPEIAAYANSIFKKLPQKNIQLIEGKFEDHFQSCLQEMKPCDILIIDGNHRYEAVKRYYSQALPYLSSEALIVFDDIRWSKGMLKAWKEIIADESVRLSIDLFDMGIVSLNPKLSKEHFLLR